MLGREQTAGGSDRDSTSAALERVVARFGRMMRCIGRRRGLAEDDLDDLVQEVRIRLWRWVAGADEIESVRTSYVYRAATSAAVDVIRRRRARDQETIGST